MTISLLHPSRGRAEKAGETYERWIGRITKPAYIEYIISIDKSDPDLLRYMKVYDVQARSILVNDNNSVVEATNHAAERSAGDILIYLSDDFDCPEGWNKLIEKEFEGVDSPMLLKVDDCLQNFHVGVCTIPIMNRALYERLGYFWHPDYKSMHVDVDLYETCKRLGVIKYAPHLKFPHNHYSNGKAQKDETYTRSEGNWDQGLQVLKRRRAQGFPV